MLKHWEECHSEEEKEPTFSMQVVRTFLKPLQRQVAESVAITNCEADFRMNSKNEWGAAKIPRIVIELGSKVIQEEWKGKRQQKRKIEFARPALGKENAAEKEENKKVS